MSERCLPKPEKPAIVDTPAVWLAAELESSTAWRHTFGPDEIAELDSAISVARNHSPELDLSQLGVDQFPLPTLGRLVDGIRGQIVDGVGVMLLDGFPVERYSASELRAVWWCLGNQIGTRWRCTTRSSEDAPS